MTDEFLKHTQEASQPNQETTETVEAINETSKNSFLTQNGRAGHDQSGLDLAQSQVNLETLEKQIEEIDRELRRFDIPGNNMHEQPMDTENTSQIYFPPQTKISLHSPPITPHSLQKSNVPAKTNIISTRSHHPYILPTRPHHP